MPPTPVKILGPNGKPLAAAPPARNEGRPVRARYDAAISSPESANHWANADNLSSTAENGPENRRRLRSRGRYEFANNGYAKGIVRTLANDTIGTGPRLQLQTGSRAVNARVAAEFEEWTRAIGLAEKLRTMHKARSMNGEAFGLFTTNPLLPTPVKLNLFGVEADRVATPYQFLPTAAMVDGIEYDAHGNPAFYHVLKEHPGDLIHWGEYGAFDRVPARLVVHWFIADREEQKRGVSELTPSLPLFAQLRRYTLATLSAAEIAALFAALLKSNLPPDSEGGDAAGILPFDSQEIVRGMMTALPEGYDVTQLKAEQPTTTYPQFKAELLNEVARPLNVPYNVAAGNSSGYNYSSGRLDHQVYHRAIGVDRYFLECHVLDRLLAAWLDEARLADPETVAGLDPRRLPRRRWGWDGFAHVDPEKEANAQTIRLGNGTTTMDIECAEDGNDWREIAAQQAEERAFYAELGIPYPGDAPAPAPAPAAPATDPSSTDNPAPAEATVTKLAIRANAPAAGPSSLTTTTAPAEIKAAAGEGKRPTFDILGYTGSVMSVEGFFAPIILDLTGLKAASQTIPALRDHDTGRIVGQTDSVKIDAQGVRLTGIITGENADSAEVLSQSKNGFKWQASVGASIQLRKFLEAGKTTTVNGREVTGPLWIVEQSTLSEISFVAIGADGQTSANVAATSNPSGTLQGAHTVFETWLQAKGIDPAALTDPVRAALKATFDAEQAAKAQAATAAAATANANAGTATAVQPPPVAAAAAQSLDQIFADERRERERVDEITRLTAQALRDRPGMADALERMAKTAIEAKVSAQQYELEILRATRAQPSHSGGGFAVHAPDVKATAKVIEAAICRSGGMADVEKQYGERTMDAVDARFPHGIGLVEVMTIAARENGYRGTNARDTRALLQAAFPRLDVRAEGFSTLSLPNLFGNVANKFLFTGFNAVETVWRDISSRRNVTDFKQYITYGLTGGFQYEKVGPTGELKHATAGEIGYAGQVETYGRMFAITRQHIINDDLGALTAIPKKLGRGAALKLNDVFWTVFLNNSTFFASGNANYSSGGGTALSLTSLGAGNTTFMNQTDADGYPLGIMPAILLVPNALSILGNNLVTSTMIANDTTANTQTLVNNPFAGRYKVATSAYMSNSSYTGYSTTAWYLLANPDDLPVIEVGFLNGRETPVVESADADFDTLGVQFRGYFDFGVATQEYRAGFKAAGA